MPCCTLKLYLPPPSSLTSCLHLLFPYKPTSGQYSQARMPSSCITPFLYACPLFLDTRLISPLCTHPPAHSSDPHHLHPHITPYMAVHLLFTICPSSDPHPTMHPRIPYMTMTCAHPPSIYFMFTCSKTLSMCVIFLTHTLHGTRCNNIPTNTS